MLRALRLNPLAVFGIVSLSLLAMLLLHPEEGVKAAVRGILIWWDVLFPALLPFFVISELMLGFGIVHFFGALLDPIMRPVFRIPGIGGFVMTMGFASGYPVAARLTSQIWEQRLISRAEGERLVAFTTTADPIFLIGAVSVGFFHDVSLAVVLGAAHYGSALVVGLLMRYYAAKEPASKPQEQTGDGNLLVRSFEAMHEARLRDGRPFGLMLQQAVRSGVQMVFVIGGLVVFFSTVLEMLAIGNLLPIMQQAIGGALSLAGFPAPLSEAVVGGLFEVTLGAKAAGEAAVSIPLMYKAAVGAFILSWAGLSVHAQIISVLHKTDLRYTPFLVARFIHGVLSSAGVILLWDVLQPMRQSSETALAVWAQEASPIDTIRAWSLPASMISLLFLSACLVLLASLHFFHIKMKGRYSKI
jgi:sporulation integral membrane protein YlbJ